MKNLKSMKKRLISILLSCCMMLTLMPTAVYPTDNTTEQTAAAKHVQALINALPDADSITEETVDAAQSQLTVVGALIMSIPEDGRATLLLERYEAALAAVERALLTVRVKMPDGETLTLTNVRKSDTIGSLKAKIQAQRYYPTLLQRLFVPNGGETPTELTDNTLPLSRYDEIFTETLTLQLETELPQGVYDLSGGSIEITVDEAGTQAVRQGGAVSFPVGAMTILHTDSKKPTVEYNITVTVAAGQTAAVVLDGVNIDLWATGMFYNARNEEPAVGTPAMALYGEGDVLLELDGTSRLMSGRYRAGLEKHAGGRLTVGDENGIPGTLKAGGSTGGAGIGGVSANPGSIHRTWNTRFPDYPFSAEDASVKNITITGGTIEAASYGVKGSDFRRDPDDFSDDPDQGGRSLKYSYGTGIGGGAWGEAKNITITGGTVIAASGGGISYLKGGAAIGSGGRDTLYSLEGFNVLDFRPAEAEGITITGGTVIATSTGPGAAIGSGAHGGVKNIRITGGNVTATSLAVELKNERFDIGDSAGIGGGISGNCEDVVITDGTVTATGSLGGAGIGGGGGRDTSASAEEKGGYLINSCRAVDIRIEGGTVAATAGSKGGAGIGGGAYGNATDIYITDGDVTACAFSGGAGIGGGISYKYDSFISGCGENIRISGGTIRAVTRNGVEFGCCGAGIGGGAAQRESHTDSGAGKNITVSGGVIETDVWWSAGIGGGGSADGIIVSGGNLKIRLAGYGAGIGGGGGRYPDGGIRYGGNGKNITVSGGIISISIPSDSNVAYQGAGIGGGFGSDGEDITITGGDITIENRYGSAGIGGGRYGNGRRIRIDDGRIQIKPAAYTDRGGAGIGGGGFLPDHYHDTGYATLVTGNAKNISFTGGHITVQGGTQAEDIGKGTGAGADNRATQEGLSATGGMFYRSIPAAVELSDHVVQYQVGDTVSAWQVVPDGGLAFLPRLTDENGVSLNEWYLSGEKYDFTAPVTADLTLTAQTHHCDGWSSDAESHWHACTDCGELLDAAEHTFGDWEIAAHPTAEAAGTAKHTCSVCGYVGTRNLPALDDSGHTCVYDQKRACPDTLKFAADCSKDKVYYKSCVCGAVSSTETFTVHTFGWHPMYTQAAYLYDINNHWYECHYCHMIFNVFEHYGSDCGCGYYPTEHPEHDLTFVPAKAATCTEDGNIDYYVCSGCHGTYTDAEGNDFLSKYGVFGVYSYETSDDYGAGVMIPATGHSAAGDDWMCGENAHWKLCACGKVFDRALHTYGDWRVTKEPTMEQTGERVHTCTDCGYEQVEELPKKPRPCVYELEIITPEALKTPADCTHDAVYYKSCDCGKISSTETFTAVGSALGHAFGSDWKHDETNHWHECACGEKSGNAAHSGGTADCHSKAICEICGESYGEINRNNYADLKHIGAKAATKTADGNIEYWFCEGCGKYFADKDGTREITKADTVTAKLPEERPTSPSTGDTSDFDLWIALLFISGGFITGVIVTEKKKIHQD